jgi:hypothetical protein
MYRLKLLALLILASHLTLVQANPGETVEGASRKEREIRWLWKYLPDIVRACARTVGECSNPEVKPVIDQLIQQLPLEPETFTSPRNQRLKFVSEASRPDLFQTGESETHRVAVTGLTPDADVFINSDRMGASPLQWVGWLVHESVHHLGLPDGQDRLPDKVGAAVASFAASYLIENSLAEFGHPDEVIVTFHPPDLKGQIRMYSDVLPVKLPIAADTVLGPNYKVPVCAEGEAFQGQQIEPIFWRVGYLRGDQGFGQIRGTAKITNVCVGASGAAREVLTTFVFQGEMQFWERFENRSAWWEKRWQFDPMTVAAGNYDGEDVLMDLNRTFAVESIAHEKPVVGAGETWRTQMVVRSMQGETPESCGVAISGARWFHHRVSGLTMFDWSEKCSITPLEGARYQIDMEKKFPEGFQPDLFSIPFVLLKVGEERRYAMPGGNKNFIEAVNPAAPARMKGRTWNAPGLAARASVFGQPLKHSFSIEKGRAFWLEFEYSGDQELSDIYLDVDLYVRMADGDYAQAPFNATLDDFRELVTAREVLSIFGVTRVRLRFELGDTIQGHQVAGFKLRRLSAKTGDYSWVESNIGGMLEGMFLTSELPE